MQLFLKLLSGNANSVDLGSGSALFAYAISLATLVYEILGYLLYIYITNLSFAQFTQILLKVNRWAGVTVTPPSKHHFDDTNYYQRLDTN